MKNNDNNGTTGVAGPMGRESKIERARLAVGMLPAGAEVWPADFVRGWHYVHEGSVHDWDAVAGIGAATVRTALREACKAKTAREVGSSRGRRLFHVYTAEELQERADTTRDRDAADATAETLTALGFDAWRQGSSSVSLDTKDAQRIAVVIVALQDAAGLIGSVAALSGDTRCAAMAKRIATTLGARS